MYAKIFLQIFDSSIVENPETRFTFMDLLVLADQNGVVDMTHEAIARRTNRPLELIRATIADLESPDPRSRTPDADGRRLNRLDEHRDWGWMIVNYDNFCKISSDEQRRQKNASRVAKYREKVREKKNSNAPVMVGNAPVMVGNAPVMVGNAPTLMSLHVDVPVDVPVDVAKDKKGTHFKKPTLDEIKFQCAKIGLSDNDGEKFFNYQESKGWKVGNSPMKSWPHALTTWKLNKQSYGPKANSPQSTQPKTRWDVTPDGQPIQVNL